MSSPEVDAAVGVGGQGYRVLGRVPMFVRKWPWIDGRTESGNFEDFGFLALNEMVFFVLFKSILNCIPIVCARQLKRIGNQSHLAFEYFSVLDIETMFSIWSARILQTKNTWITKWRSLRAITENALNLRNVETNWPCWDEGSCVRMRRIESSKVVAVDGKATAASTKKTKTFKYDLRN